MSEKDLLNEVWKQINDFEGLYEVSNYGRVRSLKFGKVKMMKLVKRKKRGYLHVSLYKNGKMKTYTVHRLVWIAFNGPIPDGYELDHIDGDKTNSNLNNLRCVTHKENCNNPITRKKHIEALKKIHQSSEWQRKNAEGSKKRWSDPEYKKKLTDAARKASAKSVVQLDKNTGEVIRRWDCIACVEREIGVHKESISECCRGNNKTAGGYKWRFYTPPAVIYQPEFMKYFE